VQPGGGEGEGEGGGEAPGEGARVVREGEAPDDSVGVAVGLALALPHKMPRTTCPP
jgi:hypothetical protein